MAVGEGKADSGPRRPSGAPRRAGLGTETVVIVTTAAAQEDAGYIRNVVAPPAASAARAVLTRATLICADGGAEVALGLGLTPDLVVGDLDSLDPGALRRVEAVCPVRVFPARKDKTDTHLALEAALEYEPDEVIVCGAFGDRADHSQGLLALVAGLPARPRVVLRSARQEAFFVRGLADRDTAEAAASAVPAPASAVAAPVIRGQSGDAVSLIPYTAEVTGVTTSGLGYPLAGATLRWGETLGVSNEMLGPEARVTVEGQGLLLVFHSSGAW